MRRSFYIQLLILLAAALPALAQTQLIQNGGFEASTFAPWQVSGAGASIDVGTNSLGGFPVDGSQYLSLGNTAGALQIAYQTITFPTNLVGATLSLYYDVINAGDPNGDDRLTFFITDTNQVPLINMGSITSATPTGGYIHAVTNLATYPGSNTLSIYAGKTVDLLFYVTTDPTLGSLSQFNIDDVSLVAGTTANIPANDNFAAATPILTLPLNNVVNTSYSSKEPGEPNHAGNIGGHSVWWTWTAPSIGTASINTSGSTFNTLLGVYTGTSITNLTSVASANGAASISGLASLHFNTSPGTQYFIALDGFNGQSGSAVFNFNFAVDTTVPTLTIASPVSGAIVSNSTAVVKGTAKDNVAVEVVNYSYGTNGWQPATTTNQWTNWTATILDLVPGTNLVKFQAVDTSSNLSPVRTVLLNYDVRVPIALATNGHGTITGAANGQLLNLNDTYHLTAKPAAGFGFAGWTGSFATNSPNLTFVMASNLSFTANFVDTQKPTITLTAPTANEHASNGLFNITGKAADNLAVASVFFQLNGSAWQPATPGNGAFTIWSAGVTLSPGTNVVRAYAVDTTGNVSTTNQVIFQYISSAVLLVQTNGNGSVTPNDNNHLLAVGINYSLTAVPARNWIFSNWVAQGGASFISNNPVLKFTMRSNLVLTANFVTNFFLAAEGSYAGLFAPAGQPRQQTNSGYFAINVTSTGTFSGSLTIGSQIIPLSGGKFDITGHAQLTSVRHGLPSLTTTLQLDLLNQSIHGTVTDGSFPADLNGDQNMFSAAHPSTALEGEYTLIIPGTNDPTVGPFGVSYGTVTVAAAGTLKFTGALADGTTAVSQSSIVSKDGVWPFYVSLYGGAGSLWGTNIIAGHSGVSSLSLSWINATNSSKTALYRSGFTNQQAAIAGSYFDPTQKPLLDLTSAQVTFDGGNLPFTIVNQINISANNAVTVPIAPENTNHLILTIGKTGLFNGSILNPTNSRKTIPFNGVLLQNQTNAQGFFLGSNASGSILLNNP